MESGEGVTGLGLRVLMWGAGSRQGCEAGLRAGDQGGYGKARKKGSVKWIAEECAL